MKNRTKDLSGKKFGYLTVIKFLERKNKQRWWDCICECGEKKIVSTAGLRGPFISCGCKKNIHQIKDLTSLRFKTLLVIKIAKTKNDNSYWECIYDCGKKTTLCATHLKHKGLRSCGCYLKSLRGKNSP